MPKTKQQRRLPATDAEYQHFSEEFIDAVLDPRRPWLVEYLLVFQFPPVLTQQEIASGRLAINMHEAITSDSLVPEWFGDSLRERKKEPLVTWAKQQAKQRELTKDEMAQLLDSTKSEKLRQSLKGLSARFGFRRGPRPHITQDQYTALLNVAELLRPAVAKLLVELSSTRYNIPKILEYLQEAHPDACKFLIRHQAKLEESLKDPKLLQRARKNPDARAWVIASAMAGCQYNLAFSTSIERVRDAQRRVKQSL